MMFIAKSTENWVIKLQGIRGHGQMVIILSDIDLPQHVQVLFMGFDMNIKMNGKYFVNIKLRKVISNMSSMRYPLLIL